MAEIHRVPPPSPSPPSAPRGRWPLRVLAGAAFLLIVHNFCWSILPRVAFPLSPDDLQPLPGGRAVTVAFSHSPGDTQLNPRSRVMLTEDGVPLGLKIRLPDDVPKTGGGSWCHSPGRLTFSSPHGDDPRTNGRRYVVYSPLLYSRAAGYSALLVFAVAIRGLRRQRHRPSPPSVAPEPSPVSGRALRGHATAGAVVFLATLYLSTGTLAPYANTLIPTVEQSTGYLFNIDHPHHRTLFDFAQGAPRETWENSILLRRILHAALARPWMSAFGYETGGVIFNLLLNLLGYVAGVAMIRRHVGARGALCAAWLLALYPGAAYWVGQPYAYAVIFPLSLAGFWLLLELPAARPARLALLSLALGVIYLSYDFHAYFLPASVIVLAWGRRFRAAVASAALQVLPIAAWLFILQNVVHVPLENSNTSLYRVSVASYLDASMLRGAAARLAALPETAADVFFGANFFFLPLLALAAWSLDFSARACLRHRAAPAVLTVGAALFCFFNFPPPHAGAWNLSGSWIARLYQPLFPALLLGLAVWWQELIPRDPFARSSRLALVLLTLAGNALIAFGPALNNPLRISERAFYRFYDHTDARWAYRYNLAHHGRRPLGFPRPPEPR